jgi:hypothetical protein
MPTCRICGKSFKTKQALKEHESKKCFKSIRIK